MTGNDETQTQEAQDISADEAEARFWLWKEDQSAEERSSEELLKMGIKMTGGAKMTMGKDCYIGPLWQPIETAPKDETEIIVGVDQASAWIVRCARWVENWTDGEEEYDSKDIGWWSYCNSVSQEKLEGIFEPTHWILLPEIPRD